MAFGSMARPFLKDATVCPFGFGRRLKEVKQINMTEQIISGTKRKWINLSRIPRWFQILAPLLNRLDGSTNNTTSSFF